MLCFLQKLETRHLHGVDMKHLVHILRDVPLATEERYERKKEYYRKCTRQDIQNLPRRLRASQLPFSSTGNLCSIHKGLNAHLINDIWAWLKHEFEGAVGEFLYPLIMSGLLTQEQEWSLRQMEPVLEMWRQDFQLDASPPPGRKPIQRGDRWRYQQDQCPACMMARIASDEQVLFTLFAGMVGRLSSKRAVNGGVAGEASCWTKTGSKRIRFVKYWLRKTDDGDRNLFQAGELGVQLKRWAIEMKNAENRSSTSDTTVSILTDNSSTIIDEPHEVPRPRQRDTKIGPIPRPLEVEQLTPAEPLGFTTLPRSPKFPQDIHPALRHDPFPPLQRKTSASSLYSITTLSPNDSASNFGFRPAPLRVVPQQNRDLNVPDVTENPYHYPSPTTLSLRQDSVMNPQPPPSTILSYTGGPSKREDYTDPLSHPIYNAFVSPTDGIEKYRRLLATDAANTSPRLPVPKRNSMYFAYWDRKFNGARFDGVDEEPSKEEAEAMQREVREDVGNEGVEGEGRRSTRWEDFY